jgi:hypothetical protein
VPLRVAGFSTGGGFALRFASGARAHLFDRYLLLAPSFTYRGPMMRPSSEGAAEVRSFSVPYVPRLIGLAAANAVGIHAFNGLPVIAFAVAPDSRTLTQTSGSRPISASATRSSSNSTFSERQLKMYTSADIGRPINIAMSTPPRARDTAPV